MATVALTVALLEQRDRCGSAVVVAFWIAVRFAASRAGFCLRLVIPAARRDENATLFVGAAIVHYGRGSML